MPAFPILATLVLVLAQSPPLPVTQSSVVAEARALALAGRRAEAIVLLQQSLSAKPAHSDARVLLGTVLSWEGRYDEARRELDVVLAVDPTHGDALPAAINVELWSMHPERAEELARRGLRQRPGDPGYLLARARALIALERPRDAAAVLDHLLAIAPGNDAGKQLRAGLQESRRVWQARASATYDGFENRDGWREGQVSIARATGVGLILLRGSRAERFGLEDHQIEVEMYPRLGPRTYAYIAGACAPDARLYPTYRYAADLYQNIGAGFEASLGYRRLSFGGGVDIYVGALSKYYGQWLFTARVYAVPGSPSTSTSTQASFRRYVGDGGTYFGLRYTRGAWRDDVRTADDFDTQNSDSVAGEAVFAIVRRLELSVSGSYGREDRGAQRDLRRFSLSSGLGVRF